jgi:hypothetical protein
VDLRDEEHHEDRAMQRSGETSVDFEAFGERALNEFWRDKDGGAGSICVGLEAPRRFVKAALHDPRMAILEKRRQLLDGSGYAGHFDLVGDHFPSSEHVMSILRARPGDVALEDDVSGFLDSELRAFDEVGEIGFEKRQGGAVGGARQARHWRGAGQLGMKTL